MNLFSRFFLRHMGALATHWREALLLAASVVVTLVVLEIGYRLYQYQTLPGRLFALVDAQVRADYDARADAAQQ